MTVAVLLGLLSTGLGKTLRLEKPHSWPTSASYLSVESALTPTDRLALVIGNSSYPDADAPLQQLASDAGALANALRNDSFLVDVVENARHCAALPET
jgi:hypothetical protein